MIPIHDFYKEDLRNVQVRHIPLFVRDDYEEASPHRQISCHLGFEEPSYFNSFFKKNLGVTAGEFRQRASLLYQHCNKMNYNFRLSKNDKTASTPEAFSSAGCPYLMPKGYPYPSVIFPFND